MFSMNTRHNEGMLNTFILENDNTFTDNESEDDSAAAFCSNVHHVNICLVFWNKFSFFCQIKFYLCVCLPSNIWNRLHEQSLKLQIGLHAFCPSDALTAVSPDARVICLIVNGRRSTCYYEPEPSDIHASYATRTWKSLLHFLKAQKSKLFRTIGEFDKIRSVSESEKGEINTADFYALIVYILKFPRVPKVGISKPVSSISLWKYLNIGQCDVTINANVMNLISLQARRAFHCLFVLRYLTIW